MKFTDLSKEKTIGKNIDLEATRLKTNFLNKLNLSIFSVFFLVFTFRIFLDILFKLYLEPVHGYSQFYTDINSINYILSYVGLIFCFFTLRREPIQIDNTAWFFFFLVIYVPMSSFYAMTGANSFWFIAVSSGWILCNLFLNSNLLNLSFSLPIFKQRTLKWGGILLAGTLVLILIYNLDINFEMELTEVYELRKMEPTKFFPLSDYIINTLSKVLLPIIILLSVNELFKRKKGFLFNFAVIFFSCIFIIVIYFSTGHKSMLFNIPFILGVYFILSFKDKFTSLSLSILLVLLFIALATYVTGHDLILSLIYRRTLMIPGQLGFFYHDFFQDNYIYMSNSILKDFSHYQYAKEPAYEIAIYFFDRHDMASSNGLLSDGFRHFGYIGLLIWMFLFTLIMKVLNGFSEKFTFPVLGTMAILFAKTIMDGPLFTTLLTHGFIFMFIVFFFLKPQKKPSIRRNS